MRSHHLRFFVVFYIVKHSLSHISVQLSLILQLFAHLSVTLLALVSVWVYWLASYGVVAFSKCLLDRPKPIIFVSHLFAQARVYTLFSLLDIRTLSSTIELFESKILMALMTKMSQLNWVLTHASNLLELRWWLVGWIKILQIAHALLLFMKLLVLRWINAPVHLWLRMRCWHWSIRMWQRHLLVFLNVKQWLLVLLHKVVCVILLIEKNTKR